MDVPVHADVHCTDGFYSQSTYVILNPVTKQVTHLVVRERQPPRTERLVPVRLVKETTPDLILLNCTKGEAAKSRPFIETEFLQVEIPEYDYAGDEYWVSPYTTLEIKRVQTKHQYQAIPPGESVTLPAEVDVDKAKAEFEYGVLTLTLPKSEAVQPKKIEVKIK